MYSKDSFIWRGSLKSYDCVLKSYTTFVQILTWKYTSLVRKSNIIGTSLAKIGELTQKKNNQ